MLLKLCRSGIPCNNFWNSSSLSQSTKYWLTLLLYTVKQRKPLTKNRHQVPLTAAILLLRWKPIVWVCCNFFIFNEWGHLFYLSKIMVPELLGFYFVVCFAVSLSLVWLWFPFGSFLVHQGNVQYRRETLFKKMPAYWNSKQLLAF